MQSNDQTTMKGITILLIISSAVALAAGQLVIPKFKELRSGVFYGVSKFQEQGNSYPSFNVTFVNTNFEEVKERTLLRNFLPESESFGVMSVRSQGPNDYRITCAAFDYITIVVPGPGVRSYIFTQKVYSGYN